MSAKKKFSYRKFVVKDADKSDAFQRKAAKPDSATPVKLLEKKYRSTPIPLAPGKSKVVAKLVIEKPRAKKGATDSRRPTLGKKAFYLGGKPIAFQG